MSVIVVVGGQFGSEGKGKICAHLAMTNDVDYMVRCGGPNSGHTVYVEGRRYQLQQVPAGFINEGTRLMIAPGALVNPSIFREEVKLCGLDESRITIDRNAGVIEGVDIENEKTLGLNERLGSTGTGVGSAVSRRVLRDANFCLAKDHPYLSKFTKPIRDELSNAIRRDKSVVIEGTQGFGLSLYHADKWPYRTSRDTTAHSFLSEVGLGVQNFEVIMAIRTYPIRVAGESGPLPNEIAWSDVRRESGYPHPITELTTTTRRIRRVAKFDWSVVEQAVAANAPTQIALHGADYLDYANQAITDWSGLTESARKFVSELETRLGVPVNYIGTGPTNENIVDRRIKRRADVEEETTRTSEHGALVVAD